MIAFDANRADGALPPPLAGEGWGEGFSAVENPQEEKALTRAVGAPSPASGRGEANSKLATQSHEAPGVKQ
ncbi:hypothetical protein E4K66_11005 [Bradyrhizobium frederickii]|uniref:Uncharacterized protein n=1 Tax=Bradyrhizobium frederickii TaxID=2560054 RepID=A0A4Y9LBM9_9BRAD|nr:hypothetical protein E4K66_11005 [Bradyrhizobium frederickii]